MTAPPDRIEEAWLICKGGYFYRPDCCGYTTDPLAAGLYTEERAKAEASKEPGTMKALPAQRFAMAADVRPGTLGHMLHAAAIAAAEARGREQAATVLDTCAAACDRAMIGDVAYHNRDWVEMRRDAFRYAAGKVRDLIPAALAAWNTRAPCDEEGFERMSAGELIRMGREVTRDPADGGEG